jgi:hypothetical protein
MSSEYIEFGPNGEMTGGNDPLTLDMMIEVLAAQPLNEVTNLHLSWCSYHGNHGDLALQYIHGTQRTIRELLSDMARITYMMRGSTPCWYAPQGISTGIRVTRNDFLRAVYVEVPNNLA